MRGKQVALALTALAAVAAGWLFWQMMPRSLARGRTADPVRAFAIGWNDMLERFDHAGMIDYGGWSGQREELGRLLGGLENLGPADVGKGEHALAFWIDAYNARVVYEVLGGQSPSTSFGRARLFFLTHFRVAGRNWSLDSMEKMIRRKFREPRVHFALNCASRSCPALRPGAYLMAADRLSAVLDQQAAAFLHDPTKNSFDAAHKRARLSKIFEWYGRDFKATGTSLQTFLARYRSEPPLGKLLLEGRMHVTFAPYDWSLNGTR